jgi:hypothetical protein
MDCMASKRRNEDWPRPLEPARRKRNVGAVRLARRPNVSLIWHANQIAETGSTLRSLTIRNNPACARPHEPDRVLDHVKVKPLRGGSKEPTLTQSPRAICSVPRSGRRAGLQSNKELNTRLDTPNPHVSNPPRRGAMDCFVALLLAMTFSDSS